MPPVHGNPKLRHGRNRLCFDLGCRRGRGRASGQEPDPGSAFSLLGGLGPDPDRPHFSDGAGGGDDPALYLESARLDGVGGKSGVR